MSTLTEAIARHKAAQATLDDAVAADPEDDVPAHLLDAEWDALSDLAETPCANEAELLGKLRYLLAHETMLKCGALGIDCNGGSVLVALDRHFNPKARA
jgi:hypothetical protein